MVAGNCIGLPYYDALQTNSIYSPLLFIALTNDTAELILYFTLSPCHNRAIDKTDLSISS